jgi:hypothetical protein
MHLMNPSGLWLLVALPLVVLLDLYRPRLPLREVSALALWRSAPAAGQADPPQARQRAPRALARDALAVVLLAVAACDPRFGPLAERAPSGGSGAVDALARAGICVAAAALVGTHWIRPRPVSRKQP